MGGHNPSTQLTKVTWYQRPNPGAGRPKANRESRSAERGREARGQEPELFAIPGTEAGLNGAANRAQINKSELVRFARRAVT